MRQQLRRRLKASLSAGANAALHNLDANEGAAREDGPFSMETDMLRNP